MRLDGDKLWKHKADDETIHRLERYFPGGVELPEPGPERDRVLSALHYLGVPVLWCMATLRLTGTVFPLERQHQCGIKRVRGAMPREPYPFERKKKRRHDGDNHVWV